jgi:hypothetical protein
MNRNWSNEELIQAVKQSTSLRQVAKILGLSSSGGETNKRLRRKIWELGLNTDHFVYCGKAKEIATLVGLNPKATREEHLLSSVLIENSPFDNLRKYRSFLIEMGILTDYCVGCFSDSIVSFGEKKRISLQIDHINGDNRDHRPNNLRHLCPTCHALQPTEAGRKSKGRKKRSHVRGTTAVDPAKQETQGRSQESEGLGK